MSAGPPDARGTRGPVTASIGVSPARVSRGGAATVTITLSLAPGWVAGSAVRDPRSAVEPTSVQLGLAEGLAPGAMVVPEGSVDPLGGERRSSYAGTVAFTVPLTVAEDADLGPAPVAARVLFQAAGEGRVLPPDRIEIATEIEIVEAPRGAAAQARSAETSS